MKLVIAIVQAYDADRLLRAIASAGLRATKITSVGGFLRMSNATIMMALDTADVPIAIAAIKENCQARVEVQMDVATAEFDEWFPAGVHEVTVGGAVVFTMPLSEIVRIFPDTMDRKG